MASTFQAIQSNHSLRKLFNPILFGPYLLLNRICMAGMTRNRAEIRSFVPNDLHVKYYSERAKHTAIVFTESTAVSPRGNAYPGGCGIWNDMQTQAWSRVTEAVHGVNGKLFIQLSHAGRAAASIFTGLTPVAPSPVQIRTIDEYRRITESEMPKELKEKEIQGIIDDFKKCAENAMKSGFDGIELQGGSGYLIDQFLRDSTNKRTDKYGGSRENRIRFVLDIVDQVASVCGRDKLGIKLSPVSRYNDMYDSNPVLLYKLLLRELSKKKITFVELTQEKNSNDQCHLYEATSEEQMPTVLKTLRPIFKGITIGNCMITPEEANKLISDGVVDMVSFGRLFISNPDLPLRLLKGYELSSPNSETFYTPGPEGYIDYPKYEKKY